MKPEQRRKWMTYTLLALMLIALSLLFSNLPQLSGIFRDFVSIISSVLFGFIFAYLMNPVMMVVERFVMRIMNRHDVSERRASKFSRGIGIVVALIVFIACVYALLVLLIPQLGESVKKLISVENLLSARSKVDSWLKKIVAGGPLEEFYAENSTKAFDAIQEWLTTKLLNESLLLNVAEFAFGAVKSVVNILLGLVVAIYMLAYKDTFRAQAKKLTVAMFKPERADHIIDTAKRSNKILSGFLLGKVLDSAIVAVLCYIGMRIMGMPYPELISAIIGVTNMIPFFGPLLGIIPSAFIILVEDPLTAFYFIIFVLALQQVDGNLIGPRILGETVGISDFWILVSITVFGGLFGFAGMLFGVPIFAVLYMIVSDMINGALKKKKQPLDTRLYRDIQNISDLHPEHDEDETAVLPTYEAVYDPDDELEIEELDSNADEDSGAELYGIADDEVSINN